MNAIKLVNVRSALYKSLEYTHEAHECKSHVELFKFQHLYENDHGCSVLKLYSQKHYITSKYTDIRYWEALQFESKADITMFVLKWT